MFNSIRKGKYKINHKCNKMYINSNSNNNNINLLIVKIINNNNIRVTISLGKKY